ncbi:hypothetical protein TUM12370_18650 [Salmonella enterica subsp. enterica serovar Choleraesuis]|nr:hypothetical protein TUM12370_18650 [Salmonella enterica subsp. enterica serovar Choleraesuis]
MDYNISPTQLAFEYLRREQENLTPAQYLQRFRQLQLEFADVLALSSGELNEEIFLASRMGIH